LVQQRRCPDFSTLDERAAWVYSEGATNVRIGVNGDGTGWTREDPRSFRGLNADYVIF